MSEMKLAPCPFPSCGSTKCEVVRDHLGGFQVVCNRCKSRGPWWGHGEGVVAEWNALRDLIVALEAQVATLRTACEEVVQWGNAYPFSVFPEPDLKKAQALLEAGGITLDAISAHAMRHVIAGAARIANAALDASAPEGDNEL